MSRTPSGSTWPRGTPDRVPIPIEAGLVTLEGQATLLEHPRRRDIRRPDERSDGVELERGKGVPKRRANELGRVPLAPVHRVEIIADFDPPPWLEGIDVQPTPSDDTAIGSEDDRPGGKAERGFELRVGSMPAGTVLT